MKVINQLNARLARKQSKGGFSLVELLVVIAVIGIIAAIAIPAMSGIFASSRDAKNRKNAQALVSVFNSAAAAGAPLPTLVDSGTDKTKREDAAKAIAAHFNTPQEGTGVTRTSVFAISMEPTEAAAAWQYLSANTAAVSGKVIPVYTAGGDGITDGAAAAVTN
jgi:prepilin-type N-terminal cleavage/methylation domain-containing protein